MCICGWIFNVNLCSIYANQNPFNKIMEICFCAGVTCDNMSFQFNCYVLYDKLANRGMDGSVRCFSISI